MKKWIYTVLSSVIIIPAIAFSWSNITMIWAGPEKLAEVAKRQEKQASALEQIAQVTLENKSRQDKEEAVSNLQIQSLKEQLALIAEIKKG